MGTPSPPIPTQSSFSLINPLANQPEFFQAVIEHTSDIVAVVDGGGILHYQSPSVYPILGYAPEEGLGEPAFQNVHPDDIARYLPFLPERLANADVLVETGQIELRVQHKNGSWRTLAVTSSALVTFNGQTYLVTTAHDVTKQKEIEIEQRSQQQFAEALQDIAATLNSTHNFGALLEQILYQVARVIPHTTASVALLQDGVMQFVRHQGYVERGMGEFLDNARIPLEDLPGFKREALAKGVALVADTATSPEWQADEYNGWIRSYLSASVDVQGHPAGLINLTSDRPNFFAQRDAQRLRAFANQVAVAFENSQLFAEYEQTIAREQQLNAVSSLLNSSLDLTTILWEVTRLAMALLSAQGGIVGLMEPDGEHIRRVHVNGLPQELVTLRLPRGHGVAWEAVEQRRLVWVENYPAHMFAKPPLVTLGVTHILCVPMLSGAHCVGVLQLLFTQPERRFLQRDLDLLESVARQAAVAVENAHLFAETEHRATELAALYQASEALLTSTNLKVLGEQIVTAAVEELAQTYCVLLLLDEERTELYPLAENSPFDASFLNAAISLTRVGLVTEAVKRKTVIYAPDVEVEPLYLRINDWTRSELVIPLQVDNHVIGVLNLESRHRNAFDDQRRRVLLAFAERAALTLQSALLFEQVEQAASYTALLNEMTQAALQTNSFEHLTHTLAERLQGLLKADGSALMVVDPTTQQVRYRAVSASLRAEYLAYRQLGQSLLLDQLVQAAGGTLVVEDVLASQMFAPALTAIFKSRAILAVMLKDGEQSNGFAAIVFRQPRRFSAKEVSQMQQAGREISLAIAHRNLMQKMDYARQVAEEANRLKTEFLANTSHELRTPLSGIIGALELARDEADLTTPEGRSFINAAYMAAQNLVRVIDDLLDIAKIEAGKMQIDPQPTNIALVLQEVVGLSRALAEKKNLPLKLSLPSERLPAVYVDADRTRQILLNVVGNAIKFTDKGQVTLSTHVLPDQRALSIQVQDTGIGVPADQQERLFQPFVQADGSTSRRYGGTGLGLSISRRLAELMKGSLTLHSGGLDQGSTFILVLPLA